MCPARRSTELVLAGEAGRRPRVEHDGVRVRGRGRDLLVAGEAIGGPGPGPDRRRRSGHPVAGLRRLGPGLQSAVEQGGRVPDDAEHPDEAAGRAATAVVVGDDDVVLADAETAQGGGELLR